MLYYPLAVRALCRGITLHCSLHDCVSHFRPCTLTRTPADLHSFINDHASTHEHAHTLFIVLDISNTACQHVGGCGDFLSCIIGDWD